MTTRRLKSLDHLSGRGLMTAEGRETIPVHYRLHIQRWMIRPMPGDQEIAGTFTVSASVQTDQPDQLIQGLLDDVNYHLQLVDGTRVGVSVQGTTAFSKHYKLGITDANELAKKYEDKAS